MILYILYDNSPWIQSVDGAMQNHKCDLGKSDFIITTIVSLT